MHHAAAAREGVRAAVGMDGRGWDGVDSLVAMDRFLGRQMAEVSKVK